jgi:hypothetical protein
MYAKLEFAFGIFSDLYYRISNIMIFKRVNLLPVVIFNGYKYRNCLIRESAITRHQVDIISLTAQQIGFSVVGNTYFEANTKEKLSNGGGDLPGKAFVIYNALYDCI